jgi:type II secretory pathway component GspD/PulD (secretin)
MNRACVQPALSWLLALAPLLAAALALAPTPAFAQETGVDERPAQTGPAQIGSAQTGTAQTYRLDFQSIPLSELVLIVSAITGDNYVFVPDTLSSRRITLVSPRPLSATDVSDLFIAALSMTGLRAEDRGSFWMIREN